MESFSSSSSFKHVMGKLDEILEKVDPSNKPFSVDQSAKYLNVSKSYLYQLVSSRKISFYKPEGGKLSFSKKDLDSYVYRNKFTASQELDEAAKEISGEIIS